MNEELLAFVNNYGISHLILNTTFDDDGHRWVASVDHIDENPRIYWCAWCGVHRVEVDDWKDNPPCPAVLDAKKLRGLLEKPAGV